MCNGIERPYYEMKDSEKWADIALDLTVEVPPDDLAWVVIRTAAGTP